MQSSRRHHSTASTDITPVLANINHIRRVIVSDVAKVCEEVVRVWYSRLINTKSCCTLTSDAPNSAEPHDEPFVL